MQLPYQSFWYFQRSVKTMAKRMVHKPLSLRSRLSMLDGTLVEWIWSHMNLLTAIATLSICTWAVTNDRVEIVAGIFVVGALGYFLGLIVGLGFGIAFVVVNLLSVPFTRDNVTAAILGFVGYCVASWLGYQHSEEKQMEQERAKKIHADQVLPWDMVNEVRTSLAAVRYLLFPMHDSTDQKLDLATRELSRLESLFNEFEKENQKTIKKGP
jgi:hypothetical protein